MTIKPPAAFVQQAVKTFATDNGKSLSFSAANSINNTLFAVVYASTTQTVSISDSQGNSWVALTPSATFNTNQVLSAFYCVGCKAGINTVTTLFGSSAASNDLLILEYTGIASFDQQAITTGSGVNPQSPSITPAAQNSLLIGYRAASAGNFVIAQVQEAIRSSDVGQTAVGEIVGVQKTAFFTTGICTSGPWAAGLVSFLPAAAINTTPVWSKVGAVNGLLTSSTGSGFPGLYEGTPLYESGAQILSGTVFKLWYNNKSGVCYAESNDGINWTPYSGNPIIANLYKSKIFKNGSTYYLPCCAFFTPGQIDIYTSPDGINWTLTTSGAILATSSWDSVVYHLNIIGIINGTWYALYDGGFTNGYLSGLVTSPDGVTWTKYAHNPVLPFSAPIAIFKNGRYYCWGSEITAGNGTTDVPLTIFRASSTDLINWTTIQQVIPSSYNIDGLGGGAGTLSECSDPYFVEANGKTYCYYSGHPASGGTYEQLLAIAPYPLADIVQTNEGVVGGYVQSISPASFATATSASETFTNANTQGNFLIATATWTGVTTTASIADTLGNVWVPIPSVINTGLVYQSWYCNGCKAGTNTVTVTFSQSAGATALLLAEYTGSLTLDVKNTGNSTGTSLSSGSITPSNVGEFLFGSLWSNNGSLSAEAFSNGLTAVRSPLSSQGGFFEILDSSTFAATAQSLSATGSSGANSATIFGFENASIPFPSSGAYSVPDCRDYGNFPNNSVNINGTLMYTVPNPDCRVNIPVDSRVTKPTDCRISPNIPENSRVAPPFGEAGEP